MTTKALAHSTLAVSLDLLWLPGLGLNSWREAEVTPRPKQLQSGVAIWSLTPHRPRCHISRDPGARHLSLRYANQQLEQLQKGLSGDRQLHLGQGV
jgi:hypothetical protein